MWRPSGSRHFFLHRILALLFSVVAFFWFYDHVYRKVLIGGETLVVQDVTTKSILKIRKDFGSGEAKKLRFFVSGNLKGKAFLVRSSENIRPKSYVLGPGKVEIYDESNWTDESCTFDYSPEGVSSGSLAIRYHFSTGRKR
jgi:hypothetical protein